MEPGCTAHMGLIWVPIWDPYRLLAGNEHNGRAVSHLRNRVWQL